jgi:hypothetical protein
LIRKPARLWFEYNDLNPAGFLPSGQLRFNCIAFPKWHSHKLPDRARAGIDTVKPGLIGANEIVLRVGAQLKIPGCL